MTPEAYWQGWYLWTSVAGVVATVAVTIGTTAGLALYCWLKKRLRRWR